MRWFDDQGLEPERYEQREPLRLRIDLSRRAFLQSLGGGLLVAVLARRSSEASAAPGRRRGRPSEPDALDAWLRIGPDESITVYTGKVEVGQGIRTSLAQTVADELAVELSAIRMVMGDTDLTPYDRGTHGSQSTPRMAPQLRVAAASARELLLRLAAAQWKTDPASLDVAGGTVVDQRHDRWLTYGALVGREDLSAEIDEDAAVLLPEAWRVQGESAAKVDARDVVTGRQIYVSDIQLPELHHGVVLRPPSWGAKLVSADLSVASAMDGVTVVREDDFIGVVAPDPHRAAEALAKIDAKWTDAPGVDSPGLFEHLENHPVDRQGWGGRRSDTQGSLERGRRGAKHRLSARYTIPYIAHAPLEPRAAVACWVGGAKLLVWAGTQHPFPVRDDVAQAMGIEPDQVRVRVPDTGSGYGGKHTAETAIEAARLARAAKVPVKVVWSREEDFTWAYFRPAGVMKVESATDAKGRIRAFSHENINSGSSSLECPYAIENWSVAFQPADSPARQGSYRALASTANTFARESHIDEIAAAAGVDPVELRRRHLDDKRLRAVLDAAVDKFGYKGGKLEPGRGAGVAIGTDKGGYVCTVAEVSVSGDALSIARIVTAFECGKIINPDNLQNQIEGAVVMGLGGALFEEIVLEGGTVKNPKFSHYRVPRFPDVPRLQTVLVDRPDLPSAGAGETPIVAVAPALANAVFFATGKRIRDLPLTPGGRLRSARHVAHTRPDET